MWNRTLVYLGLKEEPEEGYEVTEPDRFDPADDPHAEHSPPRGAERPLSQAEFPDDADVRTWGGRGAAASESRPAVVSSEPRIDTNVRPLRSNDSHVRAVAGGGTVTRVAVVRVTSFDDVESIGARYRTGQAVLFDAVAADKATGRRVVDFVAGLTFALRGRLRKVGTAAFLLVPDGAEVSVDERRRLSDLGYRMPGGSST